MTELLTLSLRNIPGLLQRRLISAACLRDFCSYPCAYTNKLGSLLTTSVLIKRQITSQKFYRITTYTFIQKMLALWQNYDEKKKHKYLGMLLAHQQSRSCPVCAMYVWFCVNGMGAIGDKHSVAVSALVGSGPCPEGLVCGSQEKAPAGEIPEVYPLSHSLQDPEAFPPFRWASCHFSNGGSHGVCQKGCFYIYRPPFQKTQLTPVGINASLVFSVEEKLSPVLFSLFYTSNFECNNSSSQFILA